MPKKAIIIGAGPAGLTAAYELLKRTDIEPIILEKSGDIGGISKTVNYKGNRMDMGGHRFFSKSDRVMQWWLNVMPLDDTVPESTVELTYHQQRHALHTNGHSNGHANGTQKDKDKTFLIRNRLSRIYFLRKFFTYPIQLSLDTLGKLGLVRTFSILISYLWAQLFPRRPEKSLEDFMINRFGQQLYLLFFKDYTEKVWGVPCQKISAEWGAQRIKGISIAKAIAHAVRSLKPAAKGSQDIGQKDTETSLIERFLYPKMGPGQLWEEVAAQVQAAGATLLMHYDVVKIIQSDTRVLAIQALDKQTGKRHTFEGDYFFSTMPIKELVLDMDNPVPPAPRTVAKGLQYRDFITVGILLTKLSKPAGSQAAREPLSLKDTWIYIQEKDVKVGRLQLFNNWSPHMVKDPNTVWIGMEYFCNEGDDFWRLTDAEIQEIAKDELEAIGLASTADVLDTTIHRLEKTYPAYFGTYERFHVLREYLDQFENLFLVGRNGMHKYNNTDHSMLTAMVAVDNICAGITSKDNLWEINTEKEYHEEKQEAQAQTPVPQPTPAPEKIKTYEATR